MSKDAKGARPVIIAAFNRLVLSRRRARPQVAEVLSEAGVARSTFYEHFDSRDSLLLEAMKGPLSVVADATLGASDAEKLTKVLDHFKANRRAAADLVAGPLRDRIVRTLADLIGERLAESSYNASLHIAEIEIGFIRLWLTGKTPYSTEDLAALMIASAAAQKAALTAPGVAAGRDAAQDAPAPTASPRRKFR
jgi:AcrR family transcriptional regulator